MKIARIHSFCSSLSYLLFKFLLFIIIIMSTDNKVKVGVVGFGKFTSSLFFSGNHHLIHHAMLGMSARVFHCPLITSSPYMHLSAVVERNSDKSKDVYPWIQVKKSTDELFADTDIDLVVITTPNGSHYPLALEAMQKGKHGKFYVCVCV